ncbi:MAG: dCMP deaminase family protein [Erysipelotrichaceae bacterium]|jgi:dCMP deaminase|nr:dCMP deaminase family protein [Erysipelotrichaceae bacterium]
MEITARTIISWDEYFMGMAFLSALRSKDPSTQVGACIVDADNKVVSNGYNGMPRLLNEAKLTWNKGKDLDNKYLYVVHAELNAILNSRAGTDLRGCRIYVTLFPCNECAKAIIQAGINEIIYYEDKYESMVETKAAKRLFDLAGVKYRAYSLRIPQISF